MNALTRIICVIVSLWLAISALLPLFGYNLIASKPGLVAFVPDRDLLYLYVIRSACFATMVFYALNFLRRRRPLSSVSPLLTFCIMLVTFGTAYLLVFDIAFGYLWIFLVFLAGLGLFFFFENEKERSVLFKDIW